MSSNELGSRGRLLIVDDDIDIADLLRMVFERAAFTVDIAHSTARAREILVQQDVAVIVMDLHLNGEQCLPLCREVRRERPGVAVVVLTGDRGVKPVVLSAGAHAVLYKPADPATIVDTVERTLRAVD